ncbi:MAG: sugar phosphate isomerase/epimerase [Anaerolineae bacterium]|nr:sugar phosphate isomerase/epimerase [Anaerolineae bacterium]
MRTGRDPGHARLSAQSDAFVAQVKAAADDAGLPFGCIAVDGAHIYEDTPEARVMNRAIAYRWLDVAETLGARQVRIDAGGPEAMPDDVFDNIVAGYNDLVARGRDKGVEIVMENHWGPSLVPENVVKIIEAVHGLGLLFDTHNWADGMQEKGWAMCARYARATHIKTFTLTRTATSRRSIFRKPCALLRDAGFDGVWGIESVPPEGADEYEGVRKTIALMERVLHA